MASLASNTLSYHKLPCRPGSEASLQLRQCAQRLPAFRERTFPAPNNASVSQRKNPVFSFRPLHHPSPVSPGFHVVAAAQGNSEGGGLLGWISRAQAALPVVGLVQRLTSSEGGVGTDRLYYSEYCVRKERSLPLAVKDALLEFQARYGQMARPGVVMFWCWVATAAVGVVRREDVLLGARRMRASLDLEYELSLIDTLLDDPSKRKIATRAAATVPVEARAKVAAEAVIACCVGPAMKVDKNLLLQIIRGFFPEAQLDDLVLDE